MFCPKCGATLPEGTAFCTTCGAPLNQPQPQYQPQAQPQPQPQPQPQFQPQFQAAPQPQYRAPITKKEFLAKKADAATKKKVTLVTITMLLSLVLIAVSIAAPLAIPFYNIPAVGVALTIAEEDPDELMDELDALLDDMEEEYDMYESSMEKDERKAAKKVLSSAKNLADNFSVLNFKSFLSVAYEEGHDYIDEADLEAMEQIDMIMTVVIVMLICAFLLPLLFALLGGLCKSTALTVVAMIFTFLSQLILCGLLFVILSLAVYIVQIVLCSNIQKAYKSYRAA